MIGGNVRWTAAGITMDDGSKIAIDGGSGHGQQRHNGWQTGKAIAMGNGMAMATTAMMTQKLAAVAATTTMTTTADVVGRMASTR